MRIHRLLLPCFLVAVVASSIFQLLPAPHSSAPTLVARLTGPPAAEALIRRRMISDAFDPVLQLSGNARLIDASGPFACDPGEIWRVDVVITQGDARAEGHTQGFCSGEIGTWEALAVARGRASFGPGEAEACGRLITRAGGTVTDSDEWCNVITLEPAD